MKTRLPKALMAALFSSVAVHAADIQIGSITDTEEWNKNRDSYTILTKDGSDSYVIDQNSNFTSAIYVREGELLVNAPVSINPTGDVVCLVVAGKKNAKVTVDNATISSSHECYNVVGGADGVGELTIKNGANVFSNNCKYLFIGEPKGDSYSRETIDADGKPYVGFYLPATNGSDAVFGKGTINVEANSTLNSGWGGLFMSEGVINATGEKATVNIGGVYGSYAYLAETSNSTSIINLSGGAQCNIATAYFMTGAGGSYAHDTTAIINIDNSKFTVQANTPVSENGTSYGVTTYLGYNWQNKTNTTINVTNGGLADFQCTNTYMGANHLSEDSSVSINIDDESTFKARTVTMYNGASIENDGIVQIEKLSMQGGEVINTGVIQTMNENDNILELLGQGSKIINSGIIENDIVLYSGTVTGLDEGEFAGLHLLGGSLRIEGTVKFNSFFSGYSAGELVFTEGGLLDMQNNYFALNSSVLVFEVGFDVSEDTTLTLSDFIVNAGGYGISDDTVLTIRGTNGTSINRTYGQVIPEPTTATLSLLALAGLAARRRRR